MSDPVSFFPEDDSMYIVEINSPFAEKSSILYQKESREPTMNKNVFEWDF